MIDFSLRNRPPTPTPTVPRLIIGITGHRPDKLGGYKWDNPLRNWCRERIRTETQALMVETIDELMRAPKRIDPRDFEQQ